MPNTIRQFTRYVPVAVAFVIVYFETFYWIAGSWGSYQGSHGPIILSISLYIIWRKREHFGRLNTSSNILSGAALTTTGCLFLIAGRFGSILLLQYLSIIITLLGLVLLLGGINYLKALWFPIVYLIFMFPLFSELLSIFSIYLQTAAAFLANTVLSIAGIAVYRHGVFLELPSVTLEVARECNGINHIMALVSLAIPLAHWTQTSSAKKMLLIVSAFFIGVLANGLRVAIIGLLAVYKPGGPLHGPYDLFYVSFIFFFGMFFLMALSSFMTRNQAKESIKHTPFAPKQSQNNLSPLRLLPLAIGVGIFIFTGIYLNFFKPEAIPLNKPFEEFPYKIGNWTGRDTKFTEFPFIYFLADNELKRIYRDNEGHEINLYIGYFTSQVQEREIVHYRFDPLQQNASQIKFSSNERDEFQIKNTLINNYGPSQKIYFWYDINGRIIIDRYEAKLTTILDAVFHHKSNAAIAVISTVGGKENKNPAEFELDFIRNTFPIIRSYLQTDKI